MADLAHKVVYHGVRPQCQSVNCWSPESRPAACQLVSGTWRGGCYCMPHAARIAKELNTAYPDEEPWEIAEIRTTRDVKLVGKIIEEKDHDKIPRGVVRLPGDG